MPPGLRIQYLISECRDLRKIKMNVKAYKQLLLSLLLFNKFHF